MNNKKAQFDMEILASPGFVILALMAVSATVLGWTFASKFGVETRFPVWQLLVIILGELIAAYVIAARG